MKILILGGSGFIGSHVADELTNRGHKVTILDIKKSPYLKNKQKFIKGNICNLKSLQKNFKNNKIVFNFAGLADLDEAMTKPLEAAESNIVGLINILTACKKYKIKKFIHASSIYANSREGSFYAASKRCAEDFIEEFRKRYNLNYVILRFGSLYGSRANKNNGIRLIINNILKKKELKYSGSKKASRRYIHVQDASKACAEILNNKYQNTCINITGRKKITISKMFNRISRIFNVKKKVKYLNKTNSGHYDSNPTKYKLRESKNFFIKYEKDFYKSFLELTKMKV